MDTRTWNPLQAYLPISSHVSPSAQKDEEPVLDTQRAPHQFWSKTRDRFLGRFGQTTCLSGSPKLNAGDPWVSRTCPFDPHMSPVLSGPSSRSSLDSHRHEQCSPEAGGLPYIKT